jgi:hypothetical protein
LNRADANRAARLYLFHHEAYHNAAETFSARLEVSHRLPAYLTGIVSCYHQVQLPSGLHEEGLASAYGTDKVRRTLLHGAPMPQRVLRAKRFASAYALRLFHQSLPWPYASAEQILSKRISFDHCEQEWQEAVHSGSNLNLRTAVSSLWLAFPRAMAPSLARNKSYSYVIRRSHPIVVRAAKVPLFSRRAFLKRLEDVVDGQLGGVVN